MKKKRKKKKRKKKIYYATEICSKNEDMHGKELTFLFGN
jgi:hypothetical protein